MLALGLQIPVCRLVLFSAGIEAGVYFWLCRLRNLCHCTLSVCPSLSLIARLESRRSTGCTELAPHCVIWRIRKPSTFLASVMYDVYRGDFRCSYGLRSLQTEVQEFCKILLGICVLLYRVGPRAQCSCVRPACAKCVGSSFEMLVWFQGSSTWDWNVASDLFTQWASSCCNYNPAWMAKFADTQINRKRINFHVVSPKGQEKWCLDR